ncbi:sulfoxide reductase heme-binding subunit YedZ [Roseospira navarrensis]|uniref:Protein-methionine-sulfoxide reductase heme-binding subunit MsrQ n=2 Tax=Roseospira navarrensis TaxID=140058 RepID=A0A7X1ZB84_9PROT|nr:sulfoxide reductase heme-binding subunit YedZ [Roseospira navarrensis]
MADRTGKAAPRGRERRRAPVKDRVWWWAVFGACGAPLAALGLWAATGDLGVNPVETIVRHLGDWALRLLVATLAISPLRYLTGSTRPIRYRRMVGLWSFAYAVLHVTAYAVVDIGLHGPTMISDLTERPYIMVGMAGLLTLIPLAATSPQAMVRRLGGRRWKRLHRLVYVAGALGAAHYLMMVKADITEPMIYIALLVLLYGIRLGRWIVGRSV